MQIDLENIGPVKKANITLKDLTIICGPNNTGKTYISYTIYNILKNLNDNIYLNFLDKYKKELFSNKRLTLPFDECVKEVEKEMKTAGQKYQPNLHKVFATSKKHFTKAKINIDIPPAIKPENRLHSSLTNTNGTPFITITKDKGSKEFFVQLGEEYNDLPSFLILKTISNTLLSYFFDPIVSKVNIQSAERCGIALFGDDIDFNKISLLRYLQNKKTDTRSLINSILEEENILYAQPIKDNLNWYKQIRKDAKKDGEFEEVANYIAENILHGSIFFTDEGTLKYGPESDNDIPIHLTSSAIKSLAGMVLFMRHQAKKGAFLIIDEPELNLHPQNQIKVARAIAMLVNNGIKVLVTTHSDYFIKEINNMLMLSNKGKEIKILCEKYKYEKDMILNTDQVATYYAGQDGFLQEIKADSYGFNIDTFDEVIVNQDNISQELFDAIED